MRGGDEEVKTLSKRNENINFKARFSYNKNNKTLKSQVKWYLGGVYTEIDIARVGFGHITPKDYIQIKIQFKEEDDGDE